MASSDEDLTDSSDFISEETDALSSTYTFNISGFHGTSEESKYRDNQMSINETLCREHRKAIDYYCKTHACTLCQDCVVISHKQCSNIVKCAQVLQSYLDRKPEMKDFIERNKKATGAMKSDIQSCEDQLLEDRDIVKTEIRSLKEAIVNKLDMTETELFTDIDTKCNIQLDMYRKRRESCESIQKQLTDSSEVLSTLTDKSKPEFAVSTLIDMQKSRESELSSIQNMKVNFQRYKLTFTEDAGIDNFLRKCSQFGHVNESFTVLSQADFLTSEDVARERRQASASQFNMLQLQTMIDAKLRGEQRNWITSVCFLADNRVVLIDRYNEKVKMFSEDCEFLDSYFFENTRLFAVASTNVDEIAVTLPVKMKIQIISTVGNRFKVENAIDTKQPCFGIAISFNHLFVCCATVKHMPCCIKIFDAEYQFVRDITFDNEGVAMFTSLSKAFIAVAPEQNNVSVVDKRSDRHTIVTFDVNGKVKSRDPMPLWSDKVHGLAYNDSSLYIALQNRALFTLNLADNSKGRKELNGVRTSETLKWPYAVAINSTKSRIAVSQVHPQFYFEGHNIVRIFTLPNPENDESI